MSARHDRPFGLLLRLLAYARPYLALVLVTIGFSLLYAGGLTGRAYLTRPVVDDVAVPGLESGSLRELLASAPEQAIDAEARESERARLEARVSERLNELLLFALVLVLGMPAVRLVRDYSGEWVMTRMFVDLQSDLCARLLRLPLARHHEGRGDVVARTLNDTVLANRAQSLVFGEALQDVAIIVGGLGGAFWLHWRLAVVTVVVGPPVAIVLQLFGRRIRSSSQARQEQISEVVQRLMQILSGIKVIKAFRAEGAEYDGFHREVLRYFRRAMRVIRNRVLSRTLVELVTQTAFVALLLVGVYAIIEGLWELTLGTLMAFLLLSGMLYRPLKNLTRLYNAVQDALPSAQRLFEILDAEGEPEDPPDAAALSSVREGVQFRNVWFGYADEPVLQGVNLRIGAGEVVALVGRTGVGKTTLADLLLRFYAPGRGSIEIDGIDLGKVATASLRDLVAVVTQEAFLFDTTVLDNIRYGRPDASFDEVVAAARAANAHEFIEGLPEGYATAVGELGAKLSGGQRQRLTIARALLRDPQVLIFDEATSALDAKAERLVQEAIWNLMKGRTVLLIAHRLSTVQACDRIAVLEDGRITMTGSHDELYARGGLYRELVELQLAPTTSAA